MEEYWSPPAGGLMLGAGRLLADGRAVFFEHMRIIERSGTLVYVAMPMGGASVEFSLAHLSANEAVFENPAHDFPQRIVYRLEGEELVTTAGGTGQQPIVSRLRSW